MGYIDSAVRWAVDIANNDSYRYVWGGWGASDGGYDCGHFVITAYTQAGIDVKGAGATYTGDMPGAFMKCGFQNVTNSVNLSTGSGMLKGDVLINSSKHAALVQKDGGTTVEAWCSKYGIVSDKAYRNDNWDYVLRYPEERTGGAATLQPQRQEVITVPTGLGKTYTYETWNREEHGYSAWSKGSKLCAIADVMFCRHLYTSDSVCGRAKFQVYPNDDSEKEKGSIILSDVVGVEESPTTHGYGRFFIVKATDGTYYLGYDSVFSTSTNIFDYRVSGLNVEAIAPKHLSLSSYSNVLESEIISTKQ